LGTRPVPTDILQVRGSHPNRLLTRYLKCPHCTPRGPAAHLLLCRRFLSWKPLQAGNTRHLFRAWASPRRKILDLPNHAHFSPVFLSFFLSFFTFRLLSLHNHLSLLSLHALFVLLPHIIDLPWRDLYSMHSTNSLPPVCNTS